MNKSRLFWGIFAGVMLLSIFLRTWHHHEWLYFKWDQGRDAALLSEAVEKGPGYLPLLGPRAAKVGQDYLHLGPAYYYFQYLPAAILNSTDPAAFAYFDLIMSILTIPMLFVFCRLFFSKENSLIITTMYAFSFLVVQYSRFAWNPNSVPFFMLITFYGILRFADSKKLKNQIKWLALWALGFSMASQFHFYAFFAIVGISGIFFIYHFNLFRFRDLKENLKRTFSKNMLKVYGVALAVILVTNIPMIISEIKTGGNNAKNFVGAFSEKSREDKTFYEKLVRNFREQSNAYFLLTTSFEHRAGKKSDPIPVVFGLFSMFIGIYLSIKFYREEKNQAKKNFLFLIPTWIIFFFLLTITTSYGLRPRYFVPIFPLPFIIIALFLICLKRHSGKNYVVLVTLLVATIIGLNFFGIKQWFTNTALSQNYAISTHRNLILQKDDGITLGQFIRATDYILSQSDPNDDHILMWSKAEYKQPLEYLLGKKRPDVNWDFIGKPGELYGKTTVFAVNTTVGGYDSITKDIKKHTSIKKETQFGQIIVIELEINPEKIEKPEPKEPKGDSGKTERIMWREVW